MSAQCFVHGGFPVADRPCAGTRTAAGFYSCCGENDVCLENKLCQRSHPENGNAAGFYTQSCTDHTFSDGACDQQCIAQLTDDVVYNANTTQWACCGDDLNTTPKCSNPTNLTFEALPPQSLLAQTVPFANLSAATSTSLSTPTTPSSSTPASSTTTIPIPSAVPSTTSSPFADPPGLSPGAKAGISIGAIAGALLIAAALFLCFRWVLKKRGYAKHSNLATQPRLEEGSAAGAGSEGFQEREVPRGELPAQTIMREVDGERPVRELFVERPEMR